MISIKESTKHCRPITHCCVDLLVYLFREITLSELVNYYRELAQYHRSSVDYHRQLLEQHSQEAEVAEKQLASIEAILHPLTIGSVNQDANGKQVNGTDPRSNGFCGWGIFQQVGDHSSN